MKRFQRVLDILDKAVNGEVIGAHGAFWHSLDLGGFLAKKVYGKQLIVPGDIEKSHLVLALRGRFPFGNDLGVAEATYPRMPAYRPAVLDEQIEFIEKWIVDGCPDDNIAEA